VCQRSNGYTAPTVVCNGTVKVNSARLRAQKSEQRQKAHRTVNSDCLVHHRSVRWPSCQKLQRSKLNGLVTWLAHRTVRCAIRQKPSPMVLLVVGPIDTPNHHTSMYPSFQPSYLIQELYHSIQDTNKEIKSSPKSRITPNKLVTRERDICVHLSSCAWIAFLLPSFLFPTQL
jgi:hypothetical protein